MLRDKGKPAEIIYYSWGVSAGKAIWSLSIDLKDQMKYSGYISVLVKEGQITFTSVLSPSKFWMIMIN